MLEVGPGIRGKSQVHDQLPPPSGGLSGKPDLLLFQILKGIDQAGQIHRRRGDLVREGQGMQSNVDSLTEPTTGSQGEQIPIPESEQQIGPSQTPTGPGQDLGQGPNLDQIQPSAPGGIPSRAEHPLPQKAE